MTNKYKWKSKKWMFYSILERSIKIYPRQDWNKTRIVLVLSNAKSLCGRAIVIECSTKQQDKHSIKLKENSWAMPNRIHTIHVMKLGVHFKIEQEMPTLEQRQEIINSIKNYLTAETK